MRGKLALGAAALAMMTGCGEAANPEELGYVLLDIQAQEAGFRLDGALSDRLPLSVAEDEIVSLMGPEGERALQPAAGELLYVRGATGEVARFQLGDEVTPDAVYVVGNEDAAEALSARADDAEVMRAEDGWYQLAGREALLLLADGRAPNGLVEVVPVEPIGTASAAPEETIQGSALIATPEMRQLSLAGALGTPQLGFGDASSLRGTSLLKRKVACEDPVAGLWVTRYHDSSVNDWHFFTLEVRRDSEDSQRLSGRIRTRFWSGQNDNTWPEACGDLPESRWGRRFDVTIEMPAEGTFDGASFSFGGTDWHEKAQRCSSGHGWYNYNVDQFDGVLTDGGRIIEAVVNDGARTHNQAQQLQRISCL